MEAVVNCVAYDNRGHKLRDITVEEISDFLQQENTFVWIGLHEPGQQLLMEVQEEFGLHDLATEDAYQAHQRSKLDAYGDTLFIVLKTAQFWSGSLHFGETHLFLGKRYLISIRHGASTSYAQLRQRCEQQPDCLRLGPSYALYAIMDYIVDNYSPVVDAFEEDLNNVEHLIFEGAFNRTTIERLYHLKRQLVELRLAVVPVVDICNQLVRFHPELIPPAMSPYFRDIRDHTIRINEAIDTMREMLTAAMDVNISLVTISQNESVKRLAGWAAILALPTLVASVYGMNFEFMPELTWRFGYPAVITLTAIGCLSLYRRLKRAGWL
ncbi:MAG: magnesium/cobalt transporter CorA [Chromatiales bacterium]